MPEARQYFPKEHKEWLDNKMRRELALQDDRTRPEWKDRVAKDFLEQWTPPPEVRGDASKYEVYKKSIVKVRQCPRSLHRIVP